MSTGFGDSPGGEKRVQKILAKIAGYTREVADDAALIALARDGELMPYDPVWHPKMARWAHAQEIDFLVPAFLAARAAFEAKLAAEAERRRTLGFFGRLLDKLKGR